MEKAQNLLAEWKEAQEHHAPCVQEKRPQQWSAPSQGRIKINVDAGWSGPHSTGLGFVARDHRGIIMLAGICLEAQRLDPLIAEAMALRWSLHTALEVGLDSVIFELDSLSVVKATRTNSSLWTIQNLMQDCIYLASLFTSISFNHVSRNANVPAHTLASLACSYNTKLWWDVPPPEIEHALFVDAALSD
ncbi:uncharacterized protein LOC130744617 [Lotus japonicus]|uniref:uncharacterized protein LOC130744617 n=1 Tax=Lotus japonicus TaxID=34305 RepID=UPI0025854D5D|nr:uncharacterized protein LOC130744617 [Lotus japonicus]